MMFNKRMILHPINWLIFSGLLLLTPYLGYLFFHITAEFFSIFIAFAIYVLAYNTRRYHNSNYFIFLGIMYIFVGTLDFIHTLAYKGMNILPISSPNYSPSLWIGSRYIESISLLILPYLIDKKIREYILYPIYSGISILLVMSIIWWNNFPVSYVEGKGLTLFKIVSEYLIVAILIVSMVLLYRKKSKLDKEVYFYLFLSILFTIFSELCFTMYVNLYAFINQIGHVFKIISFYYIFRAIIVTGLNKPFDTIFRELKQNEMELMKSNERLKQLSEMKDDFLAIASHDLRSPFNGIFGFTEILLKSNDLSPENRKYAELIQKSAKIQLHYINDILDLLKVESGNMQVNKKPINVKKLIEEDIQIHQILAFKKDISISFISEYDGYVSADYEKIVQVLNNLISNALKFTPANGTVSVKALQKNHDTLEIHVIDNGIGIPEDEQKKLFARYYQGVHETTNNVKSTGLGLSICKQLVHLHRGEIFLNSIPGKGSDFYFTLPITG